MGKSIIHIYGASGSGTTTLGKFVSGQLGYTFMNQSRAASDDEEGYCRVR